MECGIRSWQMEDAPDLTIAINNPNVQKNLRDGPPYPYTENDARDYISLMQSADPNSVFAFAITADNRCIGSIAFFRKENIHYRTAEIGYYIAEPFWGKGFGSSAVQQGCNYLFQSTDILRIFAEPFAYNTASCRILEKNGFVCEGILRSNAVKNGQLLDMKLYARIKEGHL